MESNDFLQNLASDINDNLIRSHMADLVKQLNLFASVETPEVVIAGPTPSYSIKVTVAIRDNADTLRKLIDSFMYGSCKWDCHVLGIPSVTTNEPFTNTVVLEATLIKEFNDDYTVDDLVREIDYKTCILKNRTNGGK